MKIVDFGNCIKSTDGLAVVRGSPIYMAPECPFRQISAVRSAAVKAKEARSSDGGLNNNGGNNPADDGWDFLNSDDVRMVDVYAFGTPYPPYPLVLR